MDKPRFDLGWGNPYFLLEILDRQVGPVLLGHQIRTMSYGPDQGDEGLINQTKQLIKQVTGLEYKNVIITAGATQAINSVFRYEREINDTQWVGMNKYGFPFYDDMVKYSNLNRVSNKELMLEMEANNEIFFLIDSPGNPMGSQSTFQFNRTYWDAVYHNKIYNADMDKMPRHLAMVGSYSKLLGLSGARIGWIATNDDHLFKGLADVVLKDTATISVPGQHLISSVLERLNVEYFLQAGHNSLALNKEEVQKIAHIFDGQPIPECGMFYCVDAESKAVSILTNAGVKFTKLDGLKIRISLGQTNEITQKAVAAILKEDSL